MHWRRHLWPGGTVCLVTVLLLLPSLAWASSEEGGGLVNLDRSLIIQFVNFIVLLLILWRLLYRPLLATMEQRSEAIRKSLEEAQAARAEAARQQEENTTRLRQAHAEAAAIRERALKEAGEEQRKLVEAARLEAQHLVDSAKAQTEADIRRAREELRREVAELATAVAEKLIHKSLREEDHRRVIADTLGRLGR